MSADVNVDGLLGEQRYNTVSGDLSLTRSGGSVRVNSVSGDVTMRAEQAVRRPGRYRLRRPHRHRPDASDGLRANAVSGDVEIEGQLGAGHEYRIDTVSGDVSVGLLGGATFEVRGISSDVVSDLDHRIEGRQDRRRVVVGAGGPDFIFNSMSGRPGDPAAAPPGPHGTGAADATRPASTAGRSDASPTTSWRSCRPWSAARSTWTRPTRRLGGHDRE